MSEDKELDLSPCEDCGSTIWRAANATPDKKGFHQCSDCTEWDEAQQKWIKKNLH